MGTKSNLIVGIGTLYYDATGEALPELDDLTPPAVTITPGGSWAATGFTIDDHEFEFGVETEPVFVNEHAGPIKFALIRESFLVRFKFSEKDLTAASLGVTSSALSTVSAGADQTAQDILKFGDGSLTEKALLYVGTSPEGGSRVIHIPYVVATGNVNFAFGRGHKPFDVAYQALCDPTGTAGERVAVIYDITAVASS